MRGFGLWPALLGAAAALAIPAAAADDLLSKTLSRMDEAASHFKGLSANLAYVSHMDAIHEDDSESGTILVKRPHPNDLHVKISYTKPEPKVALIEKNKVQVYYPNSGEIQKADLGSRRSLVEMILLLGFGGTSRELKNAYDVKLGGPETVAGESATRLELKPHSAEMLEQVVKIDLWVSDKSGCTVQQKFYERGKDSLLVTYTNVQLNADIPDSAFTLGAPKGTKVDNIRKK